MKLKEFNKRGLLIDENGKIFDENCNEFRDESGNNHYLDESESTLDAIYFRQIDKGIICFEENK